MKRQLCPLPLEDAGARLCPERVGKGVGRQKLALGARQASHSWPKGCRVESTLGALNGSLGSDTSLETKRRWNPRHTQKQLLQTTIHNSVAAVRESHTQGLSRYLAGSPSSWLCVDVLRDYQPSPPCPWVPRCGEASSVQ